jgi:hypothetical protein
MEGESVGANEDIQPFTAAETYENMMVSRVGLN